MIKGKENKIADYLSRLFPVRKKQDTLRSPIASTCTSNTDFESELFNVKTTDNMQERDLERIPLTKNIKIKRIDAHNLSQTPR